MPTAKRVRPAPKRAGEPKSVFLNIPYDAAFENLLLAYIAAISAFGFTPRATLEIPFKHRRLDRIIDLIRASDYSIHDLSRVQLDRKRPRTPRFNMPFELGLTVALERTMVGSHDGTIRGIFRELCNAFVRTDRQPTVMQMMQVYRVLRASFKTILRQAGARDPFNARVFRDLSTLASAAADAIVTG